MVGEFFGSSGRKVRDDTWGDVPIDRAARTLLETRVMLRLKGISQLSFASQAFPAALHTRFEHSVGVYHLTRMTLKRILDTGAYIEDREIRGALAAALLHNAGCYPHDVAVEQLALPGFVPRAELARRRIEEGEVAEVLREEWDLEPHNVFRLVFREPNGTADETPGGFPHDITPTEYLIRDLLFGSLNLDGLDCLIRDARGAKVPFGLVDVEALINALRIVGQENRALLAVDEECAGLLQSLVFSRYLMHYNVYGHHALRARAVMFLRAVQDVIQDQKLPPEKLADQDDAGAMDLIRDAAEPESSSDVLIGRLAEHRPYRRALEIDERHPGYSSLMRLRDDAIWRRRVEEAWARYLTRYHKGVAGPFDILIDFPPRQDFSMELRLIRRPPLSGERNPVSWQDLSGMTDEDMSRIHAPLSRIRVVTSNDELTSSVRRHTDELLTIAEEVG